MNVNRVVKRAVGLCVRWGLIKHPYGREYAREQYTVTGRHTPDVEVETGESMRLSPQGRAMAVGTALLLLSVVAAGVLFASG